MLKVVDTIRDSGWRKGSGSVLIDERVVSVERERPRHVRREPAPAESNVESEAVGKGLTAWRLDFLPLEPQAVIRRKHIGDPANVETIRAVALRFRCANRDQAREIERKYLGFNTPVRPDWNVEIKNEDFALYVDVNLELGVMRKRVDTKNLVWAQR